MYVNHHKKYSIMKVKISVADTDDKDAQPLVVTFPMGAPPPTGVARQNFTLELHKSTEKGKRKRRRIVATICDQTNPQPLRYEADNFSSDSGAANRSCAYAVGVYCKTTGTLRVVPADDIYSLRPALARDSSTPQLPASTAEDQTMSKKMQLTAKFGSVRRKSELERYRMNRLSGDNIVSDSAAGLSKQIQKSVSDAKANAAVKAESVDRSFLPKGYNISTANKSEIYPLSILIPESAASIMAGPAKEFAKGKDKSGIRSQFVQEALRTGVSPENRVALYYLYQLLLVSRLEESNKGFGNYFKADIKVDRDGIQQALEVPEPVAAAISEKFWHRGRLSREKLIFNILILALTVSGFDLDPSSLAVDTKLTAVRLTVRLHTPAICTHARQKHSALDAMGLLLSNIFYVHATGSTDPRRHAVFAVRQMYLREVGCKVKSLIRKAEPGAAPAASPSSNKMYRCSLLAPLKFPDTRKRSRGPG
jgi:hypothetical protein